VAGFSGSGQEPAMLAVMTADDGKVIQSFPISNGADAEVYDPCPASTIISTVGVSNCRPSEVYDPKTGLVFVSTREGRVHILTRTRPIISVRPET
jgi:hypothetical protein